jgi:lipopolysaccharide transport system ATP-binding protein
VREILIDSLFSGDSCSLELEFDSKNKIDLSKVIITIGLKDTSNELVCFWAFDELGYKLGENENKIKLKIPQLMLRGGSYRFWLFSSYHTTRKEDFCDVIDHVKLIEVLPSDYWNSGKINRTNAKVLINGSFE